jgi:hypothetical protein
VVLGLLVHRDSLVHKELESLDLQVQGDLQEQQVLLGLLVFQELQQVKGILVLQERLVFKVVQVLLEQV